MKTPACFLCALLCLMVVLVQGYKRPKFCYAKAKEGQCGNERPSIERWYFDARYGYCGPFLWGGCGGNNNNFPNCTLCMSTCTDHEDPEGACRNILNAP
uniref:Putative kunitz-like protease inhibitor n=1 Tax=Amblyomma cajennense TaxID=34607 RepID=A0A023FSH3_AMBCJ